MRNLLLPLLGACAVEPIIVHQKGEPSSEEQPGSLPDDFEAPEDPGYPDDDQADPDTYERNGDHDLCQNLFDTMDEVSSEVALQLKTDEPATWSAEDEYLWLHFDQIKLKEGVSLYPCAFVWNYYEGEGEFGGWEDPYLKYAEGEGDEWFEYPKVSVRIKTAFDPEEIPRVYSYRFLVEDGETRELKWLAEAGHSNSQYWSCFLDGGVPECS